MSYIMTQVMSRLVEPIMLKALERQSAEESGQMCRRILSMHQSILDAVCARAPEEAAGAMARHIASFGGGT